MGIIRIYERGAGKKKRKRQPGWAQKQAEYDAWLAQVKGMSTGFARTPPKKAAKPAKEPAAPSTTVSTFPAKSFDAFKGGTVKVARPEIQYADDPEMLERERRARERKFNVAPAYNKGNDVFISEEELVRTLSSNKRRS